MGTIWPAMIRNEVEEAMLALPDYSRAGYDIAPEDIPSPFNLLESIEMGPSGEMIWRTDRDRPAPGQPPVVELRAEMHCLVVLSLCPERTLGRGARVEIHRD